MGGASAARPARDNGQVRPLLLRKPSPFEDGLLAVLLASSSLLSLAVGAGERISAQGQFRQPDALGVALVLAQTVPVAWRRRNAWPVYLLVHAAAILNIGLDYAPSLAPVGVLLAFSTVVVEGAARDAAAATAVVLAGLAVVVAVQPEQLPAGAPVVVLVLYVFLLVLSLTVRELRSHAAILEERAWWLERECAHQAEYAATAERLRLARELHDVVAHHLSVVVIQARAGGDAEDTRGSVTQRFLVIENVGREALQELRRLVGLLRSDAPATRPTIDQLPVLVEQVRTSGLPTRLRIEGDRLGLSPDVEASAYRIVQESLTNTLKHAGRARADVLVHIGVEAIEITVVDDGEPGRPQRPSSGWGLAGMKERVAVLGGRFSAGPEPQGGFRIHALLPLEEGGR